jgi:ankyrin repeat protein
LLNRHFDANDIMDNNGRTALHHATINRLAAMISLLFEFGSSVNIQDNLGRTVVHYLSQILDPALLKLFAPRPRQLDIMDNNGMACVHLAADFGNIDFFAIVVRNEGVTANRNGDFPIHLAALRGHHGLVINLLNYCQLEICNQVHRTPLHCAVYGKRKPVVRYLLSRGAAVNGSPQSFDRVTPLHQAIVGGDLSIIRLLLSKNANVNAQAFRAEVTPLHLTVERRRTRVVRLLVRHGANPDIPNAEGISARMLSLQLGRFYFPEV